MYLNPKEFMDKADSLKSLEMQLKNNLERIRTRRMNLQLEISSKRSQISALESAISSYRSREDDEHSYSSEISSCQSQISSLESDIAYCEAEDRAQAVEEKHSLNQLHETEMEELDTLYDIQESANLTAMNMDILSGVNSDYQNVANQAANSLSDNYGQLATAAEILGGALSKINPVNGIDVFNGKNMQENVYELAGKKEPSANEEYDIQLENAIAEGYDSKYQLNHSFSKANINQDDVKGTMNTSFGVPKGYIYSERYANTPEKIRLISEYADEWGKSLSYEEEYAIKDYTLDGYININAKLRHKVAKFEDGNKEKAKDIHNALRRAEVPCDCTVYRGASLEALGKYKNLSDDQLIGKVLLDRGFMSTSTQREASFEGEIKLEIFVPKKARGAFLSHGISAVGDREKEILFDRGQRLKVLGVVYDSDNVRTIQARMM